jgi:hypothetical protein
LTEQRRKPVSSVLSLDDVRKQRNSPAKPSLKPSDDIIQAVNSTIGQRLRARQQTLHFQLDISRTQLNKLGPNLTGLLSAAIAEVADLSMRGTTIEIRVNAASIGIVGRNPIDLPNSELQLQTTITDHAETMGLPVRLAWEQCVGPQLAIELTPGGFRFSRMYWLFGDVA